ncbi:MAG: PilZ domain-containing protein [Pseudomonadota bacterium]
MKERRLFPRKSLRTKVVFEDEFGDGLFYVWSEDISEGGIFLASDIPVKLGTFLYLSFVLPTHKRPIRVTGEVIRLSAPGGMGIRFVGLSDIARKRLEDFISDQ